MSGVKTKIAQLIATQAEINNVMKMWRLRDSTRPPAARNTTVFNHKWLREKCTTCAVKARHHSPCRIISRSKTQKSRAPGQTCTPSASNAVTTVTKGATFMRGDDA